MTHEQMDDYLHQILPTKEELAKWFRCDLFCADPEHKANDIWSYMYNITARKVDTYTESIKCTWTETEYYWETSCCEVFIICEGTPKENRMKYCPYCGKVIEECMN